MKICSSCLNGVPEWSKAHEKCPHCGAYWSSEGEETEAVKLRRKSKEQSEYERGNAQKRERKAAEARERKKNKGCGGVIVLLLGIVCLFGPLILGITKSLSVETVFSVSDFFILVFFLGVGLFLTNQAVKLFSDAKSPSGDWGTYKLSRTYEIINGVCALLMGILFLGIPITGLILSMIEVFETGTFKNFDITGIGVGLFFAIIGLVSIVIAFERFTGEKK